MLLLAVAYFLLFAFLAWRDFRLAVGLFILFLPAYLIRFNVGPLPTTLLEVSFGALFIVWLLRYARDDWREIFLAFKQHHWLFIFIGLFFCASVAGIFASDEWYKSLGYWRAFFLEPMLLFVMLIGRSLPLRALPLGQGEILSPSFQEGVKGELPEQGRISSDNLIWWLVLSGVSVSVLAIVQKLTGQFYPPSLWDDELAGRATSFFTTPNAVGLYLGPIVFLTVAVIASRVNLYAAKQSPWVKDIFGAGGLLRQPIFIGFLAMTLLAIFFSFSQGAWVAVGAGAVVFFYLLGFKRGVVIAALLGLGLVFYVPSLRQEAFFQDPSGQNRLRLWSYSWDYLSASPKNFVLGTGIRQFYRKIQKPFYDKEEMERLIFPHNIFLNFWTETGLLGALSFTAILGYGFYASRRIMADDKFLGAGLIAALAVVVVHGLVDVPYFKNDLAFEFWVIVAVVIASRVNLYAAKQSPRCHSRVNGNPVVNCLDPRFRGDDS